MGRGWGSDIAVDAVCFRLCFFFFVFGFVFVCVSGFVVVGRLAVAALGAGPSVCWKLCPGSVRKSKSRKDCATPTAKSDVVTSCSACCLAEWILVFYVLCHDDYEILAVIRIRIRIRSRLTLIHNLLAPSSRSWLESLAVQSINQFGTVWFGPSIDRWLAIFSRAIV